MNREEKIKRQGEWRICSNPKCQEQYHITPKSIVDIPCSCGKRLLKALRKFGAK